MAKYENLKNDLKNFLIENIKDEKENLGYYEKDLIEYYEMILEDTDGALDKDFFKEKLLEFLEDFITRY